MLKPLASCLLLAIAGIAYADDTATAQDAATIQETATPQDAATSQDAPPSQDTVAPQNTVITHGAVPYVVGQLGYARADLSDAKDAAAAATGLTDIRAKEDSVSYSAGVGLRLNEFVSFEARYMNLGKFNLSSAAGGGKVELEVTGLAIGAMGLHPISNNTSLYLRGDAILATLSIDGEESDKWQPALGVGLEHFLTDGLKLRAEYQHVFLQDDASLKLPQDSISIGLLQAI